MPAQVRNASWKPSVSATGAHPLAALEGAAWWSAVATVAVTARPRAPPICCEVLISPDASPASAGSGPVTAAMVTGTKDMPRPIAASIDGNRTSLT